MQENVRGTGEEAFGVYGNQMSDPGGVVVGVYGNRRGVADLLSLPVDSLRRRFGVTEPDSTRAYRRMVAEAIAAAESAYAASPYACEISFDSLAAMGHVLLPRGDRDLCSDAAQTVRFRTPPRKFLRGETFSPPVASNRDRRDAMRVSLWRRIGRLRAPSVRRVPPGTDGPSMHVERNSAKEVGLVKGLSFALSIASALILIAPFPSLLAAERTLSADSSLLEESKDVAIKVHVRFVDGRLEGSVDLPHGGRARLAFTHVTVDSSCLHLELSKDAKSLVFAGPRRPAKASQKCSGNGHGTQIELVHVVKLDPVALLESTHPHVEARAGFRAGEASGGERPSVLGYKSGRLGLLSPF